MHVKRHLNRLFGTFRSSQKNSRKPIGEWVGGTGPSQWELADHEESKVDASRTQLSLGQDTEIQDPNNSFDCKKPSLLKRTWSSKRRKATNQTSRKTLEENGNIPLEEGLADVVKEINATIGMMNQYTLLHNYTEENTTHATHTDIITDYGPMDNFQWEAEFSGSNHFQEPETFQNSSFEPNWACFDIPSIPSNNEESSPQLEQEKFLELLEANAQIVGGNEECANPQNTSFSIFERPQYEIRETPTSTLRRSGRRIYNTLRRKGGRKEISQDSDNENEIEASYRDRPAENGRRNWISRSFRKVVKRKQTNKRCNSDPDIRHTETIKPTEIGESNGIGKMFKKRLMGFGRSMVAASTLMPLDFEHPSYPGDSNYPRAYYEDDEDAIYEFRKYCEEQEWNKVHWQEQPQRQRAYQVGYCS